MYSEQEPSFFFKSASENVFFFAKKTDTFLNNMRRKMNSIQQAFCTVTESRKRRNTFSQVEVVSKGFGPCLVVYEGNHPI